MFFGTSINDNLEKKIITELQRLSKYETDVFIFKLEFIILTYPLKMEKQPTNIVHPTDKEMIKKELDQTFYKKLNFLKSYVFNYKKGNYASKINQYSSKLLRELTEFKHMSVKIPEINIRKLEKSHLSDLLTKIFSPNNGLPANCLYNWVINTHVLNEKTPLNWFTTTHSDISFIGPEEFDAIVNYLNKRKKNDENK